MKKLLFLLLLFPCITLAQEPKKVPTGPIRALEALVCFSEPIAIDIGSAFMDKGGDAGAVVVRKYVDSGDCIPRPSIVVNILPGTVKAPGKYGYMEFYRAIHRLTPVFILFKDWMTVEEDLHCPSDQACA